MPARKAIKHLPPNERRQHNNMMRRVQKRRKRESNSELVIATLQQATVHAQEIVATQVAQQTLPHTPETKRLLDARVATLVEQEQTEYVSELKATLVEPDTTRPTAPQQLLSNALTEIQDAQKETRAFMRKVGAILMTRPKAGAHYILKLHKARDAARAQTRQYEGELDNLQKEVECELAALVADFNDRDDRPEDREGAIVQKMGD